MKRARTHKPKIGYRSDAAYERKRAANPALAWAKRFRSSAVWQRFRAWFLARHPLCFNPFNDHSDKAAEEVHHIVGLQQSPERALDETNCAGLCEPCHTAISAMERAGKNTTRLFKAKEQDDGPAMP